MMTKLKATKLICIGIALLCVVVSAMIHLSRFWHGLLYLVVFCACVVTFLWVFAADDEPNPRMNCHGCGLCHAEKDLSFVRCGMAAGHFCKHCLPNARQGNR